MINIVMIMIVFQAVYIRIKLTIAMPAKRNFIATGYYFRDSNDFDRAMAESVQIFLEDQGNGFTDADVATKLNVNLDDNVLRYFYGDKKYGASSIVDYSRIYPDAVGGDKTAGERPRNVIEVYTKGLIKQKHKWESLQKSNASKFAQYRKNQAQFEELIKEATDMRKKCQDDVKKDAKELREEISRRIKKLNVPENFKPDFTQLKSYEDMYGYLSKVSESKELANMLQEQIKIISPQEMIANAHVLYGVVFRPESVARNESLKAPSRAFEWAPSANILGFWTVCKEPTESRETNIMSKEESYYSKKQLDMYQHDFTGAIEGGVGFVSPAALGAFSLAVSCNLAEGRNKELQEGGSTSKTEQKKASILLRKMQEVKICRSDIVIKVRELEKLKEAHEKNGADRESALLQWLQSNGTHFVLRLMFGVARYFEASGRFEGFDSENKASDVLSEALKGRVSAAGYRVGIGFMGKKSAAAEADSSETTSSGSTTHDTIQNTNITVLEKIYSNGLPTGLPSFELNHLVNSGNYYWTVIKRYYGKNELDCIWNILRSQHSQKMKDWEIDVDQLAKDLENIWIKNILKLQDLKLEAEDVDELISGEDVGTQLHMNLMEIKKGSIVLKNILLIMQTRA